MELGRRYEMRKRLLYVVQGISKDNYLTKDLIEKSALPTKKYDEIILAPTERMFDQALRGSFLRYIPKSDKYGDFLTFYLSEWVRKKVCRSVRNQYKKLKKEYDQIDILAHSLGTVIVMSSGEEDQFIEADRAIMIGSPLGFKRWSNLGLLSRWSNKHLRKYMSFSCRTMYYGWSKEDKVSNRYTNGIEKTLNHGDIKRIVPFQSKSDHSWKQYLADWTKQFLSVFDRK